MIRRTIAKVGTDVAYHAPTNVAFLELPEMVPLRTGLINLSEGDVHKCIAVDEMTVECLAIF